MQWKKTMQKVKVCKYIVNVLCNKYTITEYFFITRNVIKMFKKIIM